MDARRTDTRGGPCVAVTVLAACGGDSKPTTVVSTETAPAAPATTGPTGTEQPSGTTGTEPTSTERTPTEPLPTATGGAAVVQGTYTMTVAEESDAREYSDGDELTWSAVTRCEPDCVVELNRENANGGVTTLKLPALDKTRYGRDGTGSIDCLGRVPTKTRTSISVQKVRDEGAVQLATEIQGFVRFRFTCSNRTQQNELLRVKGRLQE